MSVAVALSPPVADTKGIGDLLKLVQGGHIGIPTFQRNFRWEANDVLDLFDSIYRGYPIGALLLWETDRTEGSATRFGPLSYPPAPGKRWLIIDGQQRLTTLTVVLLRHTAVLRGVDANWSVFFDLEHERFTLPEPRAEPPASWLPLNEVLDTKRYLAWTRRLPDEQWFARADRLAAVLRDYKVPVYTVNPEDEEDARRIFKRMNASGKPLAFDEVFGSLAGAGDPLQTLGAQTLPFGFGRLPNGTLFKVVSAIAGVDVRERRLDQLDARDASQWNDAIGRSRAALKLSFDFLREAGIPHAEVLPYRAVVAPVAKIFALAPELPDQARASLRAWLWRGIENVYFARLDGGALAGILGAIGEDVDEALAALLARVGPRRAAHDVERLHDFRSATASVFGCVLANLGPVDLATREPVAVRELLDRSGAEALQELIPRRGVPKAVAASRLRRSIANRLIQTRPVSLGDICAARSEDLATHAISADTRGALAAGDHALFLRLRAADLGAASARFFDQRIGILADKRGPSESDMNLHEDSAKRIFSLLGRAEADEAFRNSGANAVRTLRRIARPELRAAAEALRDTNMRRPHPKVDFSAADYHWGDDHRSAPQYRSLGGWCSVMIGGREFDFVDFLRVDNRWVLGFVVELAQKNPMLAIAALHDLETKSTRLDFDEIGTHYVSPTTILNVVNRMIDSIDLFRGPPAVA